LLFMRLACHFLVAFATACKSLHTWPCMHALQADGDHTPAVPNQPAVKLPAIWQQVRESVYSHRRRKVQDEDDVMVCHCPPTWRGGDGCGPKCLNRMLCIECTEVSWAVHFTAGILGMGEQGQFGFGFGRVSNWS
jgi:hypothetical protein